MSLTQEDIDEFKQIYKAFNKKASRSAERFFISPISYYLS